MKKTNNKANKISKLAIFSGSLLVAASAVMLFAPVFRTNAETSATLKINANIRSVISLALSSGNLSFDVSPTGAGVFSAGSVQAVVDTNSSGGYELYFSSEDDNTNMVTPGQSGVISSNFSGAVTSATMSSNTWGYSLDNTNFSKIPTLTSLVTIKNLDHFPTAAEKTTDIYIGMKIDTSLPSGMYKKDVIFSVLAHAPLLPTIHTITNMQEMTPEICAETNTPLATATAFDWDGSKADNDNYVPRTVLVDTRDNNRYLVSKLADGNCWMSQNLALDLIENSALTSATTDLNSKMSWEPANTTQTVQGVSWGNYQVSASTDRSYHPIATDRYLQDGKTKASTPTSSEDKYLWENAGNYYNWYAATAGSGTYSVTSGQVEDSICPKGWKLPDVSGSKNYHNLVINQYNTNGTTIVAAPLNFVRSGSYINTGSMDGIGVYGTFWSSQAANQEDASYLYIYTDGSVVYPSGYNKKGCGRSIRCVAR